MGLVAFDKAIEIINSHGIYVVGFADDCCALVGGTNLGYMVHKLRVLDELTEWGNSVGLSFNLPTIYSKAWKDCVVGKWTKH